MVVSNVTFEMFERYKKEGKEGNAESAFRVFTCSTDPGTNMPQDRDVAREFLDIAVKYGSVDGKFSKGVHLYTGDLYAKDTNLGLRMMREARDEGCNLADTLAKQLGIDLDEKDPESKAKDDIIKRAEKYAYQSAIERNQFSEEFRKNNPHIAAFHGMSNILKGEKPYESSSSYKTGSLNKKQKRIILVSFFILPVILYYLIPSVIYLFSIGVVFILLASILLLGLINKLVPSQNPYSGLDDYENFSYDTHSNFWPFSLLFGLVLCISTLLIFPKIYYSEVLLLVFPLTFILLMTPYLIFEIKNIYLTTKQLNINSKSHYTYGYTKRERNLAFVKLILWMFIYAALYLFLSNLNIFENFSLMIFSPSFFNNELGSIVNIIIIPLGYLFLYANIPQIFYAFFHDGHDDRWLLMMTKSKSFLGW